MKRKKGFLIKEKFWNCIERIPIWINEINDSLLYPVKFEYRNCKGYKGLVFSARLSEIEFLN